MSLGDITSLKVTGHSTILHSLDSDRLPGILELRPASPSFPLFLPVFSLHCSPLPTSPGFAPSCWQSDPETPRHPSSSKETQCPGHGAGYAYDYGKSCRLAGCADERVRGGASLWWLNCLWGSKEDRPDGAGGLRSEAQGNRRPLRQEAPTGAPALFVL